MKEYINKNSRRNVDSEKPEPQMAFEPTPLRDLTTELWRLCGERSSNCGSLLEPHRAVTQPTYLAHMP